MLGPSGDPREAAMLRLLREAPAAMERASRSSPSRWPTSSGIARRRRHGIYLSVRDDWVDTPQNGSGVYDRLVRPADLNTLRRGEGDFNILHVCGKGLDFRRFAGYPVQALHWADRGSRAVDRRGRPMGPAGAVPRGRQPGNHGRRLAGRLCRPGGRCHPPGRPAADPRR